MSEQEKEKGIDIIHKAYINREEFQVIVGLSRSNSNKLFNEIKSYITNELNLVLPDSRHLPGDIVFAELEKRGVTKKSVMKRFQA